ncbi:hypothetical protein LTR01_001350 [Friedmanniomyces endolithicus]|nr:hypothetical protein LTS09_001781 [Friedmanniomyces endolithicus]KAK0314527.1 hypothetical protein LTR01_001350 [Friedmanniomyces endolithicus]KAK0827672.1 hypothetical protein LTR73_005274 [Friedmanniomyces endolithicus]
MSNPFLTAASIPGHGVIHLALLPPSTPRLKTTSYQYPLKLISPAPVRTEDEARHLVHTVYLLTYGGGLVAGDTIDLTVTIEPTTRLILLTQGSTKLFKSPGLHVSQTYNITVPAVDSQGTGSLCVLDWVCNGRQANGENWSFLRYGSRNEVYLVMPDEKRKLLLRDNILLDRDDVRDGIANRMHELAVFGTLILFGPLFRSLGQFFMAEFKALSRIGGRRWESGSESGDEEVDAAAIRRAKRHKQESVDGVLWSAALLRGCVVVKFGAPEVEGGRRWLHSLLVEEGTVVRELGERALLSLR